MNDNWYPKNYNKSKLRRKLFKINRLIVDRRKIKENQEMLQNMYTRFGLICCKCNLFNYESVSMLKQKLNQIKDYVR